MMGAVAKAAETLYVFRGPSNGGLEPGVLRAPYCWLGHDGTGHTQVGSEKPRMPG